MDRWRSLANAALAVEVGMNHAPWSELAYEDWKSTCHTLHRWIQIVGKVKTTLAPWTNHGWHSTLSVSARGLTTSLISDGATPFSIEFDFLAHRLEIVTAAGDLRGFALREETVASFHRRLFQSLQELGLNVLIARQPNEVPDAIPFSRDLTHRTYDAESAGRFWRALVQISGVMQEFRSRFVGKCSPVHLFWGSLDLAVTRFSGRPAPEHPGGVPNLSDEIAREAYSHEVSSCGFWPGNEMVPYPAFYCYAYPEPSGFNEATLRPKSAFYHPQLREFILPYSEVQSSADPRGLLLEFFETSYEAAADLAGWERSHLEAGSLLRSFQDRQKSAQEAVLSRRIRA